MPTKTQTRTNPSTNEARDQVGKFVAHGDINAIGTFQLGSVKLNAAELVSFTEGYRFAEAYWRRLASDDPFEQPDVIYASVVFMLLKDPSSSKAALQGYCAALEKQVRQLMRAAENKSKQIENLQ